MASDKSQVLDPSISSDNEAVHIIREKQPGMFNALFPSPILKNLTSASKMVPLHPLQLPSPGPLQLPCPGHLGRNEQSRGRRRRIPASSQRRQCPHILSHGPLLFLLLHPRKIHRYQTSPNLRHRGLCTLCRGSLLQQPLWKRMACSSRRYAVRDLGGCVLDG